MLRVDHDMNASSPSSLLDALLAKADERQRIVSSYVRGQLDDDIRAAFELRLLDDKRLMNEVEEEAALRDAMKSLPLDTSVSADARRTPGTRFSGRFAYGMAAGLAAGLGIGLTTMPGRHSTEPTAVEQPVVVSFDTYRSAGESDPTISISLNDQAQLVLLYMAAPNRPGPFRLVLADRNGAPTLTSERVQAQTDGSLFVLVDAASVRKSESLRLEAASADEWKTTARYHLKFK